MDQKPLFAKDMNDNTEEDIESASNSGSTVSGILSYADNSRLPVVFHTSRNIAEHNSNHPTTEPALTQPSFSQSRTSNDNEIYIKSSGSEDSNTDPEPESKKVCRAIGSVNNSNTSATLAANRQSNNSLIVPQPVALVKFYDRTFVAGQLYNPVTNTYNIQPCFFDDVNMDYAGANANRSLPYIRAIDNALVVPPVAGIRGVAILVALPSRPIFKVVLERPDQVKCFSLFEMVKGEDNKWRSVEETGSNNRFTAVEMG